MARHKLISSDNIKTMLDKEMTIKDIADVLEITWGAVAYHVKKEGLIVKKRRKTIINTS